MNTLNVTTFFVALSLFSALFAVSDRTSLSSAPVVHTTRLAAGTARLHGRSPLQGDGWLGGESVSPRRHGDGTLALFFFDPADPVSAHAAKRLAALPARHADLRLVGATRSSDVAAIRSFLAESGADWTVLYGCGEVTRTAYDVGQVPCVRVLGADGDVIGRDVIALRAMLGS